MKSWVLFLLFISLFSITRGQIITTVYGGGSSPGTDGFGDGLHADSATIYDPTQACFDVFGNYYFCEGGGNRARKVDIYGIITNVAGNGSAGFNGDGGLADTSEVTTAGLVCDSIGNLYIADGYNRVRKVDKITGIISTIAGNADTGYSGDGGAATSAELNGPASICFDKSGNLYIADATNHRIRKVDTSGIITTYAGIGVSGTTGDGGPADSAEIEFPRSITIDDTGNLYIVDLGASFIRKVDISGIITTFAGAGGYVYNGDDISATSANINPVQAAFDKSGNLYIADFYNNVIRKVDIYGIIHTVAGDTVTGYTGDGGTADSAELDGVGGIAVDACGNIYISQVDIPRIRKVTFYTDTPAITISSVSGDTICSGTTVTYAATVTGSSTFAYQWLVNGAVVSTAGSTYSYTPANGDSIRCIFMGTGECSYTKDTVSSNKIIMMVNPSVTPTIHITASTGDTICAETSVTYNSVITNGGSSPAYRWFVNGVETVTAPVYAIEPVNGDTISCMLISSASCAMPDSVESNSIIMDVEASGSSSISISGPSSVKLDSPVTFTASLTGAGSDYIIIWYNRGVAFDTTTTASVTYTKDTGADEISAKVIPASSCISSATTAQPSVVNAKDEGVNNVLLQTVRVYPNPAHNSLTLTLSQGEGTLVLTNTVGQTLLTRQSNSTNTTLDISFLPAGIYLLTVTDDNGGKIVVKVVKQ